ncbi:MAG: carboxypeptidase-like regulatory domain-containing protein [Bryobacteraceae bacterium]|nr:carboxypeptidase-like regulatory domain-containing protein [Bryobacteraceae bacterium]
MDNWNSVPKFFAMILLAAVATAQAAVKLTGHVRDNQGRPPAGYVEVVTGPGRVEAHSLPTDAQGRFSIQAPNAARLIVVARAEGHVSAERELSPAPDGEPRFGLAAAGPNRAGASRHARRPTGGRGGGAAARRG